jgi:hypothetical protein
MMRRLAGSRACALCAADSLLDHFQTGPKSEPATQMQCLLRQHTDNYRLSNLGNFGGHDIVG